MDNDYQEIFDEFNFAINSALENLENKSIKPKKVMLKVILNDILNQNNNNNNNLSNILSFFQGKNNGWIKVQKNKECFIWNKIIHNLSVETDHEYFYELSSYLDLFEEKDFAWLKFSHITKKYIQFHLRFLGSRNQQHIKINIKNDLFNNLINLEGIPHKLGLESGFGFQKNIKTNSNKIELNNLPFININDL